MAVINLNNITLYRAIAILGVIAIHTTSLYTKAEESSISYWCLKLVNDIAHYAVPSFLFISGYVLTTVYDNKFNVTTFLIKRFRSLTLPYILASILFFLHNNFSAIMAATPDYIYLLKNFALAILTGDCSYHLWYIPLIFQAYLIFVIIKKTPFANNHPKAILIISIVLQILWVHYYPNFRANTPYNFILHNYVFNGKSIFTHIGYFLLGFYFATCNIKLSKSSKTYFWVAFSFLVISKIAISDYANLNTLTFKYPVLALIQSAKYMIFIILIFDLTRMSPFRENKYWLKIGKESYYIYLIHPLFIYLIAQTVIQLSWIKTNYILQSVTLFFFSFVLTMTVIELYNRISKRVYNN